MILTGEPKNSVNKHVPVPLCPPQIPHGLTKVQSRASEVRGRRLTALDMAQPGVMVSVPATGTTVRWFKPGRQHLRFKGNKTPQNLGKKSKAVSPMSQGFTASYRSFRSIKKILRKVKFIISFASSSCFATR
jgi:hypothetical protein